MAFNFEQGEILLIDKPYTWTSFDVVGRLRSLIRTHLGIRKLKSAMPEHWIRWQRGY